MGQISQTDARNLFTKRIIDVYQERIRPTAFIRSFFPGVFSPTKEVSVEVVRGFEKVAVDVVRGSEGHFNRFSKSTEKIYVPPFWREYFTATELDIYDRVLGAQGTDNTMLFTTLLNTVADKIGQLQDKIERAKEIQCAQVIRTGIVTMTNGDNIDFKRKAASIVDLAGTSGYWTTGSNDPFTAFKAAGDFMRAVGKYGSKRFIAIMGDGAFTAFQKNDVFKASMNLFNMQLNTMFPPLEAAQGSVFHGVLSAGPYRFEIWTYPEVYDDPTTGNSTDYIADREVIILPPKPRFHYASCIVPQLAMTEGGAPIAPQTGEYVYGEYLDHRRAKHDFDVQSSGVPVPVAIDQMYTMLATA